jgi:hypothetical protein
MIQRRYLGTRSRVPIQARLFHGSSHHNYLDINGPRSLSSTCIGARLITCASTPSSALNIVGRRENAPQLIIISKCLVGRKQILKLLRWLEMVATLNADNPVSH